MKSVKWFLGPCEYNNMTGIGKYSNLFIKKLKKYNNIKDVCIPFEAKSKKRFLYQLFIYPFKVMLSKYKIHVFFEEGLIYLIPFSKIRKNKSIIIYHHLPKEDNLKTKWGYFKYKIMFYLSKIFLKYTDNIITPSKFTKLQLINHYNLDPRKIKVIYNPFDIKMYEKKISRLIIDKKSFLKKYGINFTGNETLLLNVGSDEDRKNIYTFLNAFIKYIKEKENKKNKVIFIKVGKNFNKKTLYKYKRNDFPIYFLENIEEEELLKFYLISDFYIAPSLYEGFGRSLIEAQICNLPVICSNIEVYNEILGKSAIFVDRPHIENSWIEILKKLDSISKRKDELITLGKINIKRFDIDSLYKEWENVL